MGSKYLICHEQDFPGAPLCSSTLIAETEEALLEAAVKHGITVHGHANTEAFRDKIRKEFKEGTPPK